MRYSFVPVMAAAMLAAGAASAADNPAVMKPINGFVEATNAGKPIAGYFTPTQVIIDEFAPNRWSGPGAAKAWFAGLMAMSKKEQLTEGVLKLGETTRLDENGAHAYVVTPATFTFKLKGKAMREDGVMAFTLDKAGTAWKISGFSWASPEAKPQG